MQQLLLIGLNHTTAPLAVRERVAIPTDRQPALLSLLRDRFAAEAVLLSTCNRVELYAASDQPLTAGDVLAAVAQVQGISPTELSPHVYQMTGRDAVQHLFAVACSLDSMVPGETQILGQVRDAYTRSHEAGAIGPSLHPLFQRAIAVGKSVMTDTALAAGRVSIGSVAIDHARQIFETFTDKTVLCIGAGKMATAVLTSLASLKPGKLIVSNRDAARAATVAAKYGGIAASLERLDDDLVAADIVVSSTGSPLPIITRQRFESLRKRRRFRPIFMVDIAVPRDIDPAVGEIDGVYLYNVDDLQSVVASSLAGRHGAMDAARVIVQKAVDEHLTSHRAREMGPTIDQLYRRSHALAREELQRVMGRLSSIGEDEREKLEDLTRRIVNKLLHDPVKTLRESGSLHGDSGQYLHAVQQLFQLRDMPDAPADEPDAVSPPDDQTAAGSTEQTPALPNEVDFAKVRRALASLNDVDDAAQHQ